MASSCRKFLPNIFNKSKCQSCFRPKEHHSAEALESSKASRKISKCGYLFIAPDLDFANPVHRSKRWQRRFFVLYDDGELTYSVDENVNTVPQGEIDMNKCTDVFGAEEVSTHQFSIAIVVPQKTYYVKGTNREEINRWHDVLVMYPRSIKTKHRRAPTFPIPQPVANLSAKQPLNKSRSVPGDTSTNGSAENSSSASDQEADKPPPLPPRQRYNSSYHPKVQDWEEEEKENKPEDIFDISPGKAIDYEQSKRREKEREKEKEDYLPPEIDLVRTKSEHSLASSGSSRSTPEPTGPLYFRSIRSLKNKDKGVNRELRKSRSLHDLTSDDPAEEVPSSNLLKYRSRSRDDISNLGRSGDSLNRWASMEGLEGDGDHSDGAGAKPKTFFESLMNPEPPKQKPPQKGRSHSAYLKLASIPRAKHIDQYVPNEQKQSAARKKSAPDLTFGMTSLVGRNKRPNGSFSTTSSLPQNGKDSSAVSSPKPHTSQSNTPSERTAAYISSSTPRPYVSLADREREYRARKDSCSSTDSLRRYDARLSNGSGSDRGTPTGILKGSSPPLSASPPTSASMSRGDLHNRGPLRNETDELKMARTSSERKQYLSNQLTAVAAPPSSKSKSEEQTPSLDDLMFTKKGWLLMLASNGKEWVKHWFVLSGNALKYFRDAKAEDANFMSGVIDLSTCYELAEVPEAKNYGFRLKTTGGDFTLSAMTAGIRTNWMQAVQKCADTNTDGKSTLDSAPSITSMSLESWASRLKSLTAKSEGSNHVGQVRRRSDNEESKSNSRHYSDDDSDFPGMRLYRRQSRDSPPRRKTIGSEREREAIADAAKTASQAKHPVYKRRTSSDEDDGETSDTKEEVVEERTEFLQEITDLEKNISGLAQRAQEENRRARSESSERELSKTEEEKSDSESSGSLSDTKTFHFRNSSDDLEKELDRRDGLQRRSKSPANKAPSAKVLEKSRSKSPKPRLRSRSPGSKAKLRQAVKEEEVETLEAGADSAEAASNIRQDSAEKTEEPTISANYPGSLLSQKTKDGETILVELLEAEVAADTDSDNDADDESDTESMAEEIEERVRLLVASVHSVSHSWSTQVESLKAQLEHTQHQLIKMHDNNSDLKAHLHSIKRDHKDSLDDLENEQNRYLSQIADIQDEMEHKTGYLHAKLSEQNNKSEMTKLQVTTLKSQLKEARDTVEEQQAQILELKEKLEVTTLELSNTEAALSKSINEWKEEKTQMEKLAQEWQATEKLLAEECKKAVKRLKEREDDVRNKDAALKTARSEIKKQGKHIEQLEHQVKDVRALQRELKEKTAQLAQAEKTLAEKSLQLNQNTEEFERKTKRLEEMEQKLSEERRLLESRLHEAEQRLQNALKQSNITDSMNSNMMEILHEKDETIAQLEERLIENDSKIDDLLEEIAMEVQANNQFQENLDQSVSENMRLKERLSAMQEEIQVLHKDLDTAKSENAQYQNELEKMENIFQMNDKAYSSLLKESNDLKGEMALLQRKVSEQEEIIQQLSKKQGGNALAELKLKYDSVCADVSKLSSQLQDAEAKLKTAGLQSTSELPEAVPPRSESIHKEYSDLKRKFERTSQEVEKLQQSIDQSEKESVHLKAVNEKLKSQLDCLESEIHSKIEVVSGKVEELCNLSAGKQTQETDQATNKPDRPKRPKVDYENVTQELESQIQKIENRLKYAESFLKSQRPSQQAVAEDVMSEGEQSDSTKQARKRKSGSDSKQSSENELSDSDSSNIENDNPALMAKIRTLKKKTTSLESRLQETVQSLQNLNTDHKKVKDIQSKLNSSQLTLDNCQAKLGSLMADVESQKVDLSRGWVRGRLQEVLQELEESDCKQLVSSSAVEHRLKTFAEKLALEAILLGEADYIVRGKRGDTEGKSSYWKDLQDTWQMAKQERPYKPHQQSFASFAAVMAERLMENGEALTLIDKMASGFGESAEILPESQVFTTEIDARLYKDSSSNSLLQSEVSDILNKLQQQSSFDDKCKLLEMELKSVEQRLCEKENGLLTAIDAFRNQKLNDLEHMLKDQAPVSTGSEAGFDRSSVTQEVVQAELAVLLYQSVQNILTEKDMSCFEVLIKNEIDHLVLLLKTDYQYQQTVLHPGKEAGDLMVLRALVNGLLVYCATQLHNYISKKKHTKLSARDSGVSFDETKYPFFGSLKGSEVVFSFDTSQKSSLRTAVKANVTQQLDAFKGQLFGNPSDVDSQIESLAERVCDLDLDLFKDVCSLNECANTIAREALLEAQLKYLVNKVKYINQGDVQQLKQTAEKDKMEALDFMKREYEERLEKERVEYTQSTNHLRDEIDQLKCTTSQLKVTIDSQESELAMVEEYKKRMSNMEQKHKENLQFMKDKHEEYIESMKKEVQDAKNEINRLLKQQESKKKEYEEKIGALKMQKESSTGDQQKLQEEMDKLKEQHQIEIEEMKTDMRMALKSVRDQENRVGTDLQDEIVRLRQQVEEEKKQHQDEYEHELKRQKQIHQRELGRCKEDLVKLLTSVQSQGVDEASVRRKYEKEIDKLKDVCEQGLAAMERSHQKVMKEIRDTHKKEVEILKKEKDHALDEETKATQSALDAMRKAHEAQLAEEKAKMQEKLAKVFSDGDLEDIRQEYEDDLNMVREEVKILSEQYSIKCLEKSALEERLEAHVKMLKDSRKHLHELMTTNEALSIRLDEDIGSLKNQLEHISQPEEGDSKETGELKVAIGVRDLEIQQLKEELEDLRDQLQEAEDAQDETADKYNELYTNFQAEKANHELELANLKESFEKLSRDKKREESSRSRGRERNRREPKSPRSLSASPEPHESSPQPTKSTPGRKRSSKAYELRRSQSTPGMPVSQLLGGKRGSSDFEGRVISDFPRSGSGLSVAERMKKFQK
ncbi:myosin-2 heavy chain isoform X3 [Lingula anatina]|uniref:Myosin-2 heavy chain isoform X3 n=1 Tax=Lingula anatina TaxID=7574 RepID=A0A1S3J3V1_LINAN|nr:myosin-2 heavy chain isoform X3 [Lingula anatina]|eukprot:XP_013404544.1 myosin-2 heavy chain isoform X3 [Lingula anatina]